jgi:pyruvate dehydrogenase (quinone)
MSKKVAQVIVETLQSAGVKNCYGIVGDTLNTFATSLSRSDIKFVHMRHEEAGAFAAQGEALLMDRLTAVAGSCGPGSLHFINGKLGFVELEQKGEGLLPRAMFSK